MRFKSNTQMNLELIMFSNKKKLLLPKQLCFLFCKSH